jgi:hypothetical protein
LAAAYGSRIFQASKPSGGKMQVLLQDYIQHYMARQADEEPLYVFDEDFGATAPEMLQWYRPPRVVQEDLAAVLRKCCFSHLYLSLVGGVVDAKFTQRTE